MKPKSEKPTKIARPAPSAKTRATERTAKPKADKPANATEPEASPLDALLAEFHSSDARDDNFIAALLQKAYDAGRSAKRARAPRASGPTKREVAAALLRRPQGCTSRDILDATGWPAVSVPAIAKASGLLLTQTKEGRVTTYFGKAG